MDTKAMTLRHLKLFREVCRQGTMTRAAEALGMAQPPVSQAIAELERHYGTALFERRGRGLVLTEAGRRLQAYADHIAALVDEARAVLRDTEDRGDLRIGASKTVGAEVLPEVCRRYRQAFPDARLELRVDNTSVILEGLRSASLDLALVEGTVTDPQYVVEALCPDELVLLGPPDHPGGPLRPEDLAGRAFFVREAGSGTRETFEAALASRGLAWTLAGEIGGQAAIVALVEAGLGWAFLSERTAAEPVRQGRVVRVEVEGLRMVRDFQLVTHGNKRMTPALVAFSRVARETTARRA